MYIFIFLTVSIASQALQLWVIRFPLRGVVSPIEQTP